MMRWNWSQPPIMSGRYSDSLLLFAAEDFLTAFRKPASVDVKGRRVWAEGDRVEFTYPRTCNSLSGSSRDPFEIISIHLVQVDLT